MFDPIVRRMALLSIGLAGSADAVWWHTLTRQEKAKADRVAEGIASDLFDKARWMLSASEDRHVNRLTYEHFLNVQEQPCTS